MRFAESGTQAPWYFSFGHATSVAVLADAGSAGVRYPALVVKRRIRAKSSWSGAAGPDFARLSPTCPWPLANIDA
jgi:hypothetical protein